MPLLCYILDILVVVPEPMRRAANVVLASCRTKLGDDRDQIHGTFTDAIDAALLGGLLAARLA
jgi:hypothetical protein